MSDERILEHTSDPDTFEERTVAETREGGGLLISFQYRRHGDDEWRTWHDSGAYLSRVGVEALRQFLSATALEQGE